jgi:hypothetical protein
LLPPHALLVTLRMDEASFSYFDAMRREHFPPHRNKIPAHITLFHALPGEEITSVTTIMHAHAREARPFAMETCGIWLLNGGGVAYLIESPEAVALHASLQKIWYDRLKPQDKQRGLKPHVTVQNREAPETAKSLYRKLTEEFAPRTIVALGMDLWRYIEGYWEFTEYFPFNGSADKSAG